MCIWIVGGEEGSSNRNTSRDESVEAGDESVETRDESIVAGEKTQQSCYNVLYMPTLNKDLILLLKFSWFSIHQAICSRWMDSRVAMQ